GQSSSGTKIHADLWDIPYSLIFLPITENSWEAALELCRGQTDIHARSHNDDPIDPAADQAIKVLLSQGRIVQGIAEEHLVAVLIGCTFNGFGNLRVKRVGDGR